MTGYPDDWPLEPGRKFKSEHFTEEELTAKQQGNDWLRNKDAEDGVYTEYPTYDYSYTYYECNTLEELKKVFLYGNWSIRQCFTYKNLAFINQINAGDEWWTLKKFEDGRLLAFDSITMIRTINHETWKWVEDYNTSEYEDGSRFRVIRPYAARDHVADMTKKFHEDNTYLNTMARYVVGAPKDKKKDVGIYFVDIATDYFPEYIEQLLKATYQQCGSLDYIDDEFKSKYREHFELRVNDARELNERLK
uniref:Uncharacterized protein n=1 Tax=viral metagenome TaxID=1070528 RepID=A0A6M3LSX9_9ZZZZ